jgi:predicted TIM-barrel fold metal-dependent hydrolase
MPNFVFSADGHIREPNDLFTAALPAAMRKYSIRAERSDDYLVTSAGDKVIHRMRLSGPTAGYSRLNRRGASDLSGRLMDMEQEGIDAEIVFPSLGMFTFLIEEPEAELALTQIYNDWHNGFFGGHGDKFVRCAVLPVRRLDDTVAELKRVAAMGFTAAMLPSFTPAGVPAYNFDNWDSVFAAGGELGVAFVLHTGTGLESVKAEKGPGGAVINYTIQMCDAQRAIMALVAGGVLDRNPTSQVAVIESGASWLAGLAERMDEVYEAHQGFVRPKLSLTPREIIQRQVKASFQYDRACIMSRSVTGHQSVMWGSDYPHAEGTFPRSREVVAGLFDGIEISEAEKADIVGGTAARLFRFDHPKLRELKVSARPAGLSDR